MTSDPEAKAIFKQLGYLTALWVTVRSVPRILGAALEAWTMPKRWPWEPPASFMDRKLCDLRREFGIRVV
jgi:hypothetical protein